MPRYPTLRPALVALALLIARPAFATDAMSVELAAEASRAATNDLVQATVAAEASGPTPADLSRQINKAIADALKTAKGFPAVKAQSGGTSTYPVYAKNGRIESWRMRSDIALESGDTAALSELLGKLQTSLTVSNLNMTPSPETRRRTENEAMLDAIALFKARAKLLAETLGKNYSIKELSVSTGARFEPRMMREAKAMSAQAMPMPIEAGETQVTVSVSGKVEIE